MLNATAAPWRPLLQKTIPGADSNGRRSSGGGGIDRGSDSSDDEKEKAEELVIYPVRSSSSATTAGFADHFSSSSSSLGLLDWPARRPVRIDGRGGLEEFFVPGSPTFVRAARPAVLALATVAGLAVLAAVLSV